MKWWNFTPFPLDVADSFLLVNSSSEDSFRTGMEHEDSHSAASRSGVHKTAQNGSLRPINVQSMLLALGVSYGKILKCAVTLDSNQNRTLQRSQNYYNAEIAVYKAVLNAVVKVH